MPTSRSLRENSGNCWGEALLKLLERKASGSLAEVCALVGDLLSGLDLESQDYADPLTAALETISSEGFLAAYKLERFDQAASFAEIADAVARRNPDYKYGAARTAINLSLCHIERSEFVKAEELLRRALDLLAGQLDIQNLREVALSHLRLISMLRGEKRSIEFAPEPAPRGKFTGLQSRVSWLIRNDRGLDLLNRGQPREAASEFEAILRDLRDLDIAARATILSNLGSAYHRAGDAERATKILLQATGNLKAAWDIVREVAPRSRQALLILRDLGRARLAGQEFPQARACFERGLELYDEIRNDVAANAGEHEGLFSIYRSITELAIWLSVHEGERSDVLAKIERAKARFWRERVRLENRRAALPEIREIDEDELSSIGGLNALFIDLFVGKNATFVCAAFNRHLQAYRVDLKETDLAAMVDDVRKRLEVGLRADNAAKTLSDTLSRKARWDWPAHRAVLVAPDGPLWRLPMDVLPIPGSGSRLGELAPVVTIPSASVLLDMHRLESTRRRCTFSASCTRGHRPT